MSTYFSPIIKYQGRFLGSKSYRYALVCSTLKCPIQQHNLCDGWTLKYIFIILPYVGIFQMIIFIFFLCLPLSLPSLFLSYKLVKKNFLGTLFNKSIAIMFLFKGKILILIINGYITYAKQLKIMK